MDPEGKLLMGFRKASNSVSGQKVAVVFIPSAMILFNLSYNKSTLLESLNCKEMTLFICYTAGVTLSN